jgi:hypothetical protein
LNHTAPSMLHRPKQVPQVNAPVVVWRRQLGQNSPPHAPHALSESRRTILLQVAQGAACTSHAIPADAEHRSRCRGQKANWHTTHSADSAWVAQICDEQSARLHG